MKFIPTLIGSFHRAETYAQAKREASYGLGYSFLLVLLTSFITAVFVMVVFHYAVLAPRGTEKPVFDDVVTQIAQQWPTMTLKDNKLQTSSPEITTITIKTTLFDHAFDTALITVDTTGATTIANMKTPVLISADAAVVQGKEEMPEIYPYKKTQFKDDTLVINRALIDDRSEKLISWTHEHLASIYFVVGLISWFALTLVGYIARVAILLLLGTVGLAFANITNISLTYKQAVTLAAVSFTPLALGDLLMTLLFGHGTKGWILFIGGSVFLTYAIRLTREVKLAAPQ